ncbi:MAG: 6,7-dimethyl-8-ribityllumazine synthase [Candidatus Gracilibacteria bacterium]|jgi:6,7-dimethyl-8-ribityllumazine synthase
MKIAIVASEFNPEVTEPLLAECLRGLKEQGIEPLVTRVPGAVEIPLTAQKIIRNERPDAVIALGCVIKGETEHYDLVCTMCGDGIMATMLETGVPIIFEVLMVDDEKKALARIPKGYEAAFTAVKMAKLIRNAS